MRFRLHTLCKHIVENIIPLFTVGLPVYVLIDVLDWFCYMSQEELCIFNWESIGIDIVRNHRRREKADMLFALYARFCKNASAKEN